MTSGALKVAREALIRAQEAARGGSGRRDLQKDGFVKVPSGNHLYYIFYYVILYYIILYYIIF